MVKQIFINLAVNDVGKSMDFYMAKGFANNPHFSDDNTKCMLYNSNSIWYDQGPIDESS
ncbi:hypothetical protein [Echinicola salinicaeni]|uniref:hypothetical protein n=1 Tax=Echinicola salinicaeni TaxID=2762757 RepID=UPI00164823F1|nr:hypothetical protein [Echinicola salinicaeni]